MKEVEHLFVLSITMVHGIIQDVYKTIGQLSKKVIFSHQNSLLNCIIEVHIKVPYLEKEKIK